MHRFLVTLSLLFWLMSAHCKMETYIVTFDKDSVQSADTAIIDYFVSQYDTLMVWAKSQRPQTNELTVVLHPLMSASIEAYCHEIYLKRLHFLMLRLGVKNFLKNKTVQINPVFADKGFDFAFGFQLGYHFPEDN